MLFLGLFNDKRLKVKQRKITPKTKTDKYWNKYYCSFPKK